MYSNPVFSFHRRALVALLLLAGAVSGVRAQAPVSAEHPWYVGVLGGTSFGQATFSSITEHTVYWGAQGGLFGGYRFNPVLSLELSAQYGGQAQAALDCCNYWLSAAGERFMAPVLDEKGWYYSSLLTHTQWGKAALQAKLNLIGLFAKRSRWSLNLGPQISAVTTRTSLTTPDSQAQDAGRTYARQWHLGLGGQVSLEYCIANRVGVALYGGITHLTGERFDNIPVHLHQTNLLWDAGLKLSVHMGKPRRPSRDALAAAEAARLAEEAEAQRLSQVRAEAEKLSRAKEEEARLAAEAAARAEAERLAREQAEREAAARMEQAFRTPIPTVWFANDSALIDDAYVPSLEEALAILRQYPAFKLEIHAYSSRSGSRAYNERLSEERMEAVRSWFRNHGIAPERLEQAYFHGIDYNAPSADKARRAELQFVK